MAIIVEAKAGTVGHIPWMAVEIKEHARVAAVESLRRLAGDLRPVCACRVCREHKTSTQPLARKKAVSSMSSEAEQPIAS